MNIQPKMSIEKAEFDIFMAKFKAGEFKAQRLGQAFFDYFNLQKMNNNELTNAIYYADSDTAKDLIKESFNIH